MVCRNFQSILSFVKVSTISSVNVLQRNYKTSQSPHVHVFNFMLSCLPAEMYFVSTESHSVYVIGLAVIDPISILNTPLHFMLLNP